MIDVPETNPKPKSRKTCPHCGASPAGCRGSQFLRGRCCCLQCELRNGDHDGEVA